MIDNYDISIKDLDSIKNKEILTEEYKHTLTIINPYQIKQQAKLLYN